ncbi:MAG: hypothetical protein WKF97_22080 [Chitinophagaceae bacterium]
MNTLNPYKGLFAYTAKDENVFFGRTRETADLLEMIKNNQLVVLYGESGTGKTSLIKAKLFPELKRQYFYPIYIRLNFTTQSDPLEQVRKRIYEDLKEWDPNIPSFSPDLTLIEYAAKTSLFGGLIKPILFFDQFEELFTLSPKYIHPSVLETFIDQLADLIEVRLPGKYKKTLVSAGDAEMPDEQTCNENVLKFTVVFSLRQDYIAQLDDLKYKIPSIISNKYRIKKFDSGQALDAVIEPAKKFVEANKLNEHNIVEVDTAKMIIKELGVPTIIADYKTNKNRKIISDTLASTNAGNSEPIFDNLAIDPTILSLYCFQLFEEAQSALSAGFSSAATKLFNTSKKTESIQGVVITPALVQRFKPDDILKKYYSDKLSRHQQVKRSIEKYLITKDGRRILKSFDLFIQESGLSENTVQSVIDDSAILRIYGEREGREIEVVHDQIARQALISRKIRESNRIKIVGSAIAIGILVISILITSQYVNSKTNLTSLNNQIESLAKQNDELEMKNSSIQNALENQRSEFKVEERNKSQTINDVNNLRYELSKERLQTKDYNARVARLQYNNQILDNKYKGLQSENAMLTQELRKEQTERNANQNNSNNYTITIATLQNENKQLKESLQSLQTKYDQLINPVNKSKLPSKQQKQQQKQ